MKYTPNYNLKKPDETDYIMVEDLNENMDTVDGELKAVNDKVDSFSIDEHINDPMPHRMTDGVKTYKYGFGIDNEKGAVVFNYEEVI